MKKSTINPLGYFITMRAYGTWLHGDKRLSVNRKNNQYGTPKIKRNGHFEKQMMDELKYPPVYFDHACEYTILEQGDKMACIDNLM